MIDASSFVFTLVASTGKRKEDGVSDANAVHPRGEPAATTAMQIAPGPSDEQRRSQAELPFKAPLDDETQITTYGDSPQRPPTMAMDLSECAKPVDGSRDTAKTMSAPQTRPSAPTSSLEAAPTSMAQPTISLTGRPIPPAAATATATGPSDEIRRRSLTKPRSPGHSPGVKLTWDSQMGGGSYDDDDQDEHGRHKRRGRRSTKRLMTGEVEEEEDVWVIPHQEDDFEFGAIRVAATITPPKPSKYRQPPPAVQPFVTSTTATTTARDAKASLRDEFDFSPIRDAAPSPPAQLGASPDVKRISSRPARIYGSQSPLDSPSANNFSVSTGPSGLSSSTVSLRPASPTTLLESFTKVRDETTASRTATSTNRTAATATTANVIQSSMQGEDSLMGQAAKLDLFSPDLMEEGDYEDDDRDHPVGASESKLLKPSSTSSSPSRRHSGQKWCWIQSERGGYFFAAEEVDGASGNGGGKDGGVFRRLLDSGDENVVETPINVRRMDLLAGDTCLVLQPTSLLAADEETTNKRKAKKKPSPAVEYAPAFVSSHRHSDTNNNNNKNDDNAVDEGTAESQLCISFLARPLEIYIVPLADICLSEEDVARRDRTPRRLPSLSSTREPRNKVTTTTSAATTATTITTTSTTSAPLPKANDTTRGRCTTAPPTSSSRSATSATRATKRARSPTTPHHVLGVEKPPTSKKSRLPLATQAAPVASLPPPLTPGNKSNNNTDDVIPPRTTKSIFEGCQFLLTGAGKSDKEVKGTFCSLRRR